MKKTIKIVVICCLFLTQACALKEDVLLDQMRSKINNATKLLQNKTMDETQKEHALFNLFDPVFDFELMSKLSLGRQWMSLTNEQQELYKKTFEDKLKASYMDQLNLYTNQQVLVQGITKTKSNRIELLMHIKGTEDTYEVIYKFYKNKQNDWLIYDINILGVSMIQTYINQFVGVLQKDSFEALIQKLSEVKAISK
ncbi:ABC transporter substrate-binding protein [Candidatus Marinarcus aquaticus]|uniref:Toluene tolerance protein n=1 Tax=Candidatus Marinarcus aquaticus TaxID=2044504 RepID=A0A4Q0XLU1_9BACT|nr:ABC transporter substrate-binding protein [Candidatus Marinarcus aquaticus]RXJ53758.1 toluene tolerance protein [Candidatus Marinarcus aquaticus]